MTETKRDLHADLAICSAASSGFMAEASVFVGPHGPYLEVSVLTEDCEQLNSDDTTFIVKARTGWPHALERAINAEVAVQSWYAEVQSESTRADRAASALRELLNAIDSGHLQRTKLSSGLDYVIYNAREAIKSE